MQAQVTSPGVKPAESINALATKLKKAVFQLPFVGRKSEIQAIITCLVSKGNLVMIGPPGTAKSLMVMEIAKILRKGNAPINFFNKLQTQFTKPSEIFGEIDVKVMKETGLTKHITTNRFPEAIIAFLDEIFKCSSATLNALLRALNEKLFENGPDIVKIPLWSCFAASNELPQDESLDALYDRFQFRIFVDSLDENAWDKLISMWNIKFDTTVTLDFKVIEELNAKIDTIDFSPLQSDYISILKTLKDHNVIVSNRRMIQNVKAIIADSLLNSGGVLSKRNLSILKYTIPKNREELQIIEQVLIDVIGKTDRIVNQINELIPQLDGFIEKLDKTGADNIDTVIKISTKIQAMRVQIENMKKEVDDNDSHLFDEIDAKVNTFNSKLVGVLNKK